MTGVVALPFLFLITFSGLLIFAYIYFPSPEQLMTPLIKAQETAEATRTGLPEHPAGQPATLASVDAMMAAAKAHWAAAGVPGEIGSVDVAHLGDVNAYVSISRDTVDRVATAETLHFSGTTGALLYEEPPLGAIEATSGFLYGLHFQFFKHWGLRWLLFSGGLIGCVCIATGFLFFVEKRKKEARHRGRLRRARRRCAGGDDRDRHAHRNGRHDARHQGAPGEAPGLGDRLAAAGLLADLGSGVGPCRPAIEGGGVRRRVVGLGRTMLGRGRTRARGGGRQLDRHGRPSDQDDWRGLLAGGLCRSRPSRRGGGRGVGRAEARPPGSRHPSETQHCPGAR